MMDLMFDELDTEVGTIALVCHEAHLIAVEFEDFKARMNGYLTARFGEFRLVSVPDPLGIRSRLTDYFGGNFAALDEVTVDPFGTHFQQTVWRALREIPVGHTVSYGQLAARIGKPSASRAVGMANSKNPIGIVIPCHRVIGANGALTGYAGGLERKRWLLAHEQVSRQLSLLC
jgi:methylated-DNA-[protein]-cysteine S-methyltransferase